MSTDFKFNFTLFVIAAFAFFVVISSILSKIDDLRRNRYYEAKKELDKKIEEKDRQIEELKEENKLLRNGEIPTLKEDEYKRKMERLTTERDSARADALKWRRDYEHDIGYPIDIKTGARYKNTLLQEHPSQPPEPISQEEIASAVLLCQFDAASKRADNVLEPLLFSGLQEEDLCESIKGNAFGRIKTSDFEIEKVFVRCSSEPTEGDVWSKFGTHIPTLVPITGKTPLFIKIKSNQKNGTYREYYTSLSSCSCDSGIQPCKHSVFLAQQIGALYYNQEKSALILDDKINELKQEAAAVAEKKKENQKTKKAKKGA